MVLFLIWLENFQRGSRGWSSKNESNQPTARIKPKHKFTRWMLTSIATIVLLICFIMPLSQLIYWVSLTWKNVVDQEFFMLIYRSFSLAIGSAIIIALLSIFLLYAVRLSPLKWTKYITKVSSIRSEEHTSELQSRGHLVCRLLLEKKKKYTTHTNNIQHITV